MTKTSAQPTAKRADAQRNIAAILDAAMMCLSRNPDTSIGEIARVAGVGRVTLYAHFSSRAELIEAVTARAIREGDEVLGALDLTGDPRRALFRLIESSWMLIVNVGSVMVAAETALPPGRIRELHDQPATRVDELIARAQREGVFRTDLPLSWLVGTLQMVMHGATGEIRVGRLRPDDAPTAIAATIMAAYTPPGQTVARPETWLS